MLSSVTFAKHILYCRVSDAWWEIICFNAVFCLNDSDVIYISKLNSIIVNCISERLMVE